MWRQALRHSADVASGDGQLYLCRCYSCAGLSKPHVGAPETPLQPRRCTARMFKAWRVDKRHRIGAKCAAKTGGAARAFNAMCRSTCVSNLFWFCPFSACLSHGLGHLSSLLMSSHPKYTDGKRRTSSIHSASTSRLFDMPPKWQTHRQTEKRAHLSTPAYVAHPGNIGNLRNR